MAELVIDRRFQNLLDPLPVFDGRDVHACHLWLEYLTFVFNSASGYGVEEKIERIKHAALQKSSGDCLQYIYRTLAIEASSDTKMPWDEFKKLIYQRFGEADEIAATSALRELQIIKQCPGEQELALIERMERLAVIAYKDKINDDVNQSSLVKVVIKSSS